MKAQATCFFVFMMAMLSDLSAQVVELNAEENIKRKVSVGILGSVDYCYRTLKNTDGSELYDMFISVRNQSEIPKPGFTVGLTFHIPVGSGSNLRTGFLYSNKGYQWSWRRNSQWPGQPPSEITGVKSVDSYYYLDVPLTYDVYLDRKKRNWYISTGVTTNVFLRGTFTQIVDYNGTIKRSSRKIEYEFHWINLSPEISIGRYFPIGEKISFRMAPVFRYGILKILDSPISEKLWSAGVNMSCFYTGK